MSDDLFKDDELPEDLLEHLADPEVLQRWPKKLVEIYDVVRATLARELDDATAVRLTARVVEAMAHHHGGRQWYMPAGDKLHQALRDKRIWDRFDGTADSVAALCREYGLTQQMIYKILREQRALHRKRHQPELPL